MNRPVIRNAARPDAIVRELYRLVETRNLSRLGSLLADDVCWVNAIPVGAADAAVGENPRLDGRTAVLEQLTELIDTSGGTFSLRLQSLFLDPEGTVVAFHEVSYPGRPLQTSCLVFSFDGEQIGALTALIPVPNSGRSGRLPELLREGGT
ncbi:MAG: nuclear transport factor 2 family protein [Microbacteriaceae bacterium]